MSAYVALADYYEYLMKDCDYETWSQYVCSKIKKYTKGSVGCDAACGSGVFTRALKKAGFDMTGVDLSQKMLDKAVNSGLGITYVNQDMRKLSLLKKSDFITVITDGVNYIPTGELTALFKQFHKNLKKDGILMFDISSAHKLESMAGNVYAEDDEDISYIWFNTLKGERLEMELVFFIKTEDGRYIKAEEKHIQYLHSEGEVENALAAAGFTLIEKEGHLGGALTLNPDRINFIAKRGYGQTDKDFDI